MRALVQDMQVSISRLRETVLESQAITHQARQRKVLHDAVRQKILFAALMESAEGLVDGLVYASEYSAAFGDPVVADLIRIALKLVGVRLRLEWGPTSRGHQLH